MVGFRMAGFMLSGSGIRVFVHGNMGLGWGGWGKVQVNDGEGVGVIWTGVEGVRVVVCVVYWRCLKGAVVRLMSCNAPLKVSRKSVPLGYCSWKEAVFVVVVVG
ncbi:hypothetical protein NP493_355g02008 [Ridgeia piscesae]|uniref:Uncharacterized protein n=1 Tax=Ridgeia piscesae TaxID=27915 RepID=A0AAD9L2Y1_RIDPI|nr:hypothetical protein NP493_355g02008 [Ridgeia piscesae]